MRLWPVLFCCLAACTPLPDLGAADGPPGDTPPLLPAVALDAIAAPTVEASDADLLNARGNDLRNRAAELAAEVRAKGGVAPAPAEG
jgi:hypothetical protein